MAAFSLDAKTKAAKNDSRDLAIRIEKQSPEKAVNGFLKENIATLLSQIDQAVTELESE